MKEIILKGGLAIYPIIVLSVVALTVIIERIYFLYFVEKGNTLKLKDEVVKLLERNDLNSAKALCLDNDSIGAKAIFLVLNNLEDDRELIENKLRTLLMNEGIVLDRYMWLLNISAQLSPFIGLFGTVTGMIKSFSFISSAGVAKEMIAGGIAESLISTAAGLSVAIPATAMFVFLNKKIDSLLNEAEIAATDLINMLER